MNQPNGYAAHSLPTTTGSVLIWRCLRCGTVLVPLPEDAATHDRWHDGQPQ